MTKDFMTKKRLQEEVQIRKDEYDAALAHAKNASTNLRNAAKKHFEAQLALKNHNDD